MMTSIACLVLLQVPTVQNVVVVVTDGVRASEVFSGADRALLGKAGGGETEEAGVAQFWRPTPKTRRETLMPFFWNTLAKQGQVFGDSAERSPMRVTNRQRVSYPGYHELLAGFADPRVNSNAPVLNPNRSIFEWAADQPAFSGQVQAVATWDTFFSIFAFGRSKVDVRAGWRPPFADDTTRSAEKDLIDALYRTTTPQFGGNALDAVTYATLKVSLKERHPRLLFVGLGETDEWMHHGRYDLMLSALQRADRTVEDLWNTLQAIPQYSNTTALIVTTDHGRGTLPWGWRHHGEAILGSDEVWLGMMGPGIAPLGVRREVACTSAQVASTIGQLLAIDWRRNEPRAAAPLPLLEAAR